MVGDLFTTARKAKRVKEVVSFILACRVKLGTRGVVRKRKNADPESFRGYRKGPGEGREKEVLDWIISRSSE